jgi:hypothetical protein
VLSFLRVFIPSNARLSDGSRFHSAPAHNSCKGDFLFLTVGRHCMKLLASVSHVRNGDRQDIVSASGRKLTKMFDADGTIVDFILPEELLPIVRRATMRRNVGLSTVFASRLAWGETYDEHEFTGVTLTSDSRVQDRAARLELIEV